VGSKLKNMNSILITDLDNTLYNWVDYFAPSFRGMVHALSREMNLNEETLISGFREVYKKHGTLEYSFSIQELPFINNYSNEEVLKFVELGKKVFKRVRDKNLVPYEGVKETLEILHNNGVLIIAVTNAPRYQGEARLKQLKLDKYFHGIGGWEGNIIPDNIHTKKILENVGQGYYDSKYIKKRWSFIKEEMKPNPCGYLTILSSILVSHKTTYVVGDSITKDLQPGNEIGAKCIWAKYGTKFKEKNFKTLLEITHWGEEKIDMTYNQKKIDPDYVIDSFSELKDIIKMTQQINLF